MVTAPGCLLGKGALPVPKMPIPLFTPHWMYPAAIFARSCAAVMDTPPTVKRLLYPDDPVILAEDRTGATVPPLVDGGGVVVVVVVVVVGCGCVRTGDGLGGGGGGAAGATWSRTMTVYPTGPPDDARMAPSSNTRR